MVKSDDVSSGPEPGTFPHELKRRRLELGMSQIDLGRLTQMAQPRISRFEIGKMVPKPDELAKFALALQLPLAALTLPMEMNRPRREAWGRGLGKQEIMKPKR